MENIEGFILARTLHVFTVVIWIGGVAFVTTILLPALKQMNHATDKLELFEQLEGRFALQARIVTLIAGISGYYMLDYMSAWERYQQLQFWWMHLMTFVWAVFTLVLFVLEPLVLHRWFREQAIKDSENAFTWLHRMHKILLTYQASETRRFLLLQNRHFHPPWWSDVSESLQGCIYASCYINTLHPLRQYTLSNYS